MKSISKFVCVGVTTFLAACAMAGETLFEVDFNNPAAAFPGWNGNSAVTLVKEGVNGAGCFKFDLPVGGQGSTVLISVPLDVAKLRGKSIVVEAMMKGKDITKPKADYLGPKLMLCIKSPSGTDWPDQEKKIGTFDWQKFTISKTIPADATGVDFTLGIQDCQGTLWIGDVKISVAQDK